MNNNNNNKKQKSKSKQHRNVGPIVITKKGILPRIKKWFKNNNKTQTVRYEIIAEDYQGSFWVEQPKYPNCNEIARTLASFPQMITGGFLVRCFETRWFNANPNVVIDTLAILMERGVIDQDVCDEVFGKLTPFSNAKWVEDTHWKKDAIEAFFALDRKVGGYPKNKEERTAEMAEDWFKNQVSEKLEVLQWIGTVNGYADKDGKPIPIEFALERMVLPPDAKGRTRYHIGNRAQGDQPARTQFWGFPKFATTIKHIRGRRRELKAAWLWRTVSTSIWAKLRNNENLSKHERKAVEQHSTSIGHDNPDYLAQFRAMHKKSEEE
jgi:hypothetical protein